MRIGHAAIESADSPLDIMETSAPSMSLAIAGIVFLVIAWVFAILFVLWWRSGKSDRAAQRWDWAWRIAVGVFVFAVGIGVALLLIRYLAGAILLKLIHHYDVDFLGVEVTLESLQLNPFNGILKASGLVIENPPGYRTSHLLSVDSLHFDVDIAPIILSLTKHIVISAVEVHNVSVIYETGFTTSNINDVIKKLGIKGSTSGSGDRKVSLHKTDLTGITAKAAASLFGAPGVTVSVADIRYQDFEAQTKTSVADDIVKLLLDSVLKSVKVAFGR